MEANLISSNRVTMFFSQCLEEQALEMQSSLSLQRLRRSATAKMICGFANLMFKDRGLVITWCLRPRTASSTRLLRSVCRGRVRITPPP